VRARKLPAGTWFYTDDTYMALSIYSILRQFGQIDQDKLAFDFAIHFDATRGFGPGMRRLLPAIQSGTSWQEGARKLFKGEGSLGNGGAMRSAPLGAYFADDLTLVAEQARRATEVTHIHPEGIAGGIAIAIGAAVAARFAADNVKPTRPEFIDAVLPHVPAGFTRDLIQKARDLPSPMALLDVIRVLGNGANITAMDTVPFCLWMAGEKFGDYPAALWLTAEARGDCDTNCAIVGGMVAVSMAESSDTAIPAEWLAHREPLLEWAIEG
jgi:ADP-ribosylglycohydrolase